MRAEFAGRLEMKRWEAALAVAGVVCMVLGAIWIRRGELPKQEIAIADGGCNMPVTLIHPPTGVNPAGSVILIHGLSANRRLMTYLGEDFAGHGFTAYIPDLPGHGDNTVPFTFLRVQQCGIVAIESLTRGGRIDPKTTVVVGHSMGGAIAIRMADRDPVAATIGISPAPMILPQRMPANLLVFSAGKDIGILKRQAEKLKEAAGGDRTQPDDFAQQRAFELKFVPYSTHTSLLVNRNVAHQSELWAMQALFPTAAPETLALNIDLATYETYNLGRRRLAGALIGLLGPMLMFPLCATLAAKLAGLHRAELDDPHPSRLLAIIEFAVCSMVGVLMLTLGTPLKLLHMYTGDYLASLLLIVGVMLLVLNWKDAMESLSFKIPRLLAAGVLGFAIFLAVGAWLNWQIDDAWLNAPRWVRFAALLPAMWIFSYAEELVLGPVRIGKRRALRFATFLLFRFELWIACAIAFYSLGSSQVLMVILFAFLAQFSVLQRLATDALRLRTGSATAAALFSAILAAWFIAAVFPLT
jgi:pimeloyl-ACP methyl ester carboxylesterase